MPPIRVKQRRRHRRKTDDPNKGMRRSSSTASAEPAAEGEKIRVTQYFSIAEAALIFTAVLLGICNVIWAEQWMSLAMMVTVWVLTGFWGVRLMTERGSMLVLSPVGAPIALLGLYLVGLYFFGDATVAGKPTLWLLVTCCAFFFAVLHTVRHRWQLHFTFWVLMGLGVLLAGFAVVRLFSDGPSVTSTAVFSAEQISAVMLMVIPMLGAATCLTRLPGGLKILLLTSIVVMVLTVVLAFSRAAWLATFVMLGVLFVLLVRQGVLRAVWIPLIAVGFIGLIGVGIAMSPYMKNRLQEGAALRAPDPQRFSSWDSALRMGADHPFFGVGPGMFAPNYSSYSPDAAVVSPTTASSDWLQMFAEVGVVGCALVVWLLTTLLLSSLKLIRKWKLPNWFWYQDETQNFGIRHGLTVGMIAAVIAFVTYGMLSSPLHSAGPAIVFATVIAIAMSGSRRWGKRHHQGGPASQMQDDDESLFQPSHLKPTYSRILGVAVLSASVVFTFWIGRALAASVAVELGDAKIADAMMLEDKKEAEKLFAKGRQHYERALKWDSSDYVAALRLGDFHMKRAAQVSREKFADEMRDAILYYGIATKLVPHDADAWLGLGRACDAVKDELNFSRSDDPEPIHVKADQAFNEAAMREKYNPRVHLAAAEHWLLWNQRERARESLSNAEKYITEKYLRVHPTIKQDIAALRERLNDKDSSKKNQDASKSGAEKSPSVSTDTPPPKINGVEDAPPEEQPPSP
jgi:O-antigen ligase